MTPATITDAVLNDQLQRHDLAYAGVGLHAPDEITGHLLTHGTSVVLVDVIRMTTTLTAVLAAGADPVFIEVKRNDDDVDILAKYRSIVPDVRLVLCGEKNGQPIPGGLFGNSALDVPADLAGSGAVLCSTNGGRSFEATTTLINPISGVHIFVMTMANVDAVADAICETGDSRVVVAAGGFYSRLSLEDGVAGGRLFHRLDLAAMTLDDGATAMVALADHFPTDGPLVEALHHNRIGRALTYYGRVADIPAAITGAGIDEDLWDAMTKTVGRVRWQHDVPCITTHDKEDTE